MPNQRRETNVAFGLGLVALLAAGCRGEISRDPPVHLNPNMDHQGYYRPQSENDFFADRAAQRPQVPGTVAQGEWFDDDHLYRGTAAGALAATLPAALPLRDMAAVLTRGRERYDIYCAACHGRAGTGESVIAARGLMKVPPTNLHDERLLALPVGHFFQVASAGIRNMPGYAAQIPVEDRWYIAAYVRALQLSRFATLADVPAAEAAAKGWK